ncbi:hypothetical protein Taro_043689 [Colocasia esculenta]|uniref:GBF-interacting protein 1 N-terminal domain-containing protein n=1 Tax=Colocasia esculenta TaxID=4460 RepID=A0A843WZC4_COLES|nr:hypothetical protein [Colocasia esculenta]
MSSNGEGARGAGHGGTATKKILQSIKEIVGGNFSDDEIYVMLKECNMDPSETIHHLLNQDTFHEVKSKREKKKEGKDNVDSRMRGTNNSSNRGGKGATDRASRIGSAQVSCSGNFSKSIPKKENGPNAISGSFVLGSGVGGTTATKNSTPLRSALLRNIYLALLETIFYICCSDFVLPLETTGCLTSTNDSISSQYSAGVQSSWGGTPGQRTLADIVKMGRLPGKISRAPAAPTKPNASHNAISATSQHLDAKGSSSIVLSELQPENPVSDDSDVIYEPSVSVGQHTLHDEWPVVDQTTVGTGASLLEVHGSSSVYDDPSTSLNSHVDGVSLHHSSRIDGIHLDGDIQVEDSIRPVTASDKHIQVDNSREESGLDGGPINDMKTYQSQMQNFEHHEGNLVNFQIYCWRRWGEGGRPRLGGGREGGGGLWGLDLTTEYRLARVLREGRRGGGRKEESPAWLRGGGGRRDCTSKRTFVEAGGRSGDGQRRQRPEVVVAGGAAGACSEGAAQTLAWHRRKNHGMPIGGNGVNVDLSSTAASLQWLRLDKEDITIPQVEDNPAVIIPNHLQVTNADCSHLSFGSFGSGISAGFSGSLASKTLKSNLEMPSDATDANPVDDSDARNAEYYNNEQLRPATNENADCMPSTNVESYEAPSSSQPDVIRSDAADPADGPQYQFQPSVPDYSFSNAVQPDAASYASVQGNSQIQNLASFSSVMVI